MSKKGTRGSMCGAVKPEVPRTSADEGVVGSQGVA